MSTAEIHMFVGLGLNLACLAGGFYICHKMGMWEDMKRRDKETIKAKVVNVEDKAEVQEIVEQA